MTALSFASILIFLSKVAPIMALIYALSSSLKPAEFSDWYSNIAEPVIFALPRIIMGFNGDCSCTKSSPVISALSSIVKFVLPDVSVSFSIFALPESEQVEDANNNTSPSSLPPTALSVIARNALSLTPIV